MTATGGGCTADWHLTATETSAEVALRLVAYEKSGACATVAVVTERSVVLQTPMGGRTLVDADTGRHVPFFDGRHLALIRSLPPGASDPQDRPNGHGWIRMYQFPTRPRAAPISIEQTPGNLLNEPQFSSPGFVITTTRVHGQPARLIVQRDDRGKLLLARLAWVEGGFTYDVESTPAKGFQRPFPPAELEAIAQRMKPPTPFR